MVEIIERGKEVFPLGRLFPDEASCIFLTLKYLLY